MNIVFTILGIILCVILFLAIHIIKMMRMYLCLIDEKIEFRRFVFAYLRTTLINLIIPFKLGEIYRMIVYSRMVDKKLKGVFAVIVDRFFDTMALVIIMLILLFLYPKSLTFVAIFLATFVVLIVCAYKIFEPAYGYLNRYIIVNKTTKRSMLVLKWLEALFLVYEYIRKLVEGRNMMMLLMSFFAWVIEGGFLFVFARLICVDYDAGVFLDYISSILSTKKSELLDMYTRCGILVILLGTVTSGIIYFVSRKRKKSL